MGPEGPHLSVEVLAPFRWGDHARGIAEVAFVHTQQERVCARQVC